MPAGQFAQLLQRQHSIPARKEQPVVRALKGIFKIAAYQMCRETVHRFGNLGCACLLHGSP